MIDPHAVVEVCPGASIVSLKFVTLSEAAPGFGRELLPTSPEERGPTVALSSRKAGTDHGTVAGPGHSHGIPEGFRSTRAGRAAPRGAEAVSPLPEHTGRVRHEISGTQH